MDTKDKIVKEYSKSTSLGVKDDKKEDSSSKLLSIKEINDNLSATNDSLVSILTEFKNINSVLEKQLLTKKKEAYQEEEKELEAKAVPEEKQQATNVSGDVKSLAKNPAFGAAMAGLMYLFLPKDLQETIKNGLKGFAEGISEGIGPLGELSTEVKIAGGALAAFVGSKVLTSVFDAVTTVVKITKTLANMPGRFGKMSKLGKVAAVGAVGAVGVAAGKEYMDDEEEPELEPAKVSAGAPAATGASSTGATPSAPAAATEVPAEATATAKTDTKATPVAAAAVPVTPVETKAAPAPAPVPAPAAAPKPAPATSMEKPKATVTSGASSASKTTESKFSEPTTGTGIKPGAKLGFKAGGTGGFKAVKDMIKMHEGVRNKPYKDSLGLWTVGVGHLIGDGKSLPPEWDRTFTNEEINSLFEEDFEHHKKAAEKIPGYSKINEQGKGALIDLTFNMGPSWYKKWPNFTKQLESGEYPSAAENLEGSKWYKQVGRRGSTIASLIRMGGDGSTGGDTGSSSASAMPASAGTPAPQLEVARPGKGAAVASMSESVEAAPTSSNFTQVNNIDRSSTKKIGNKQADTPPPIPSPIASRGSLANHTSHSTAYA